MYRADVDLVQGQGQREERKEQRPLDVPIEAEARGGSWLGVSMRKGREIKMSEPDLA